MLEDVFVNMPVDYLDKLEEILPPDCRFTDENGSLLLWVPGKKIHFKIKE